MTHTTAKTADLIYTIYCDYMVRCLFFFVCVPLQRVVHCTIRTRKLYWQPNTLLRTQGNNNNNNARMMTLTVMIMRYVFRVVLFLFALLMHSVHCTRLEKC